MLCRSTQKSNLAILSVWGVLVKKVSDLERKQSTPKTPKNFMDLESPGHKICFTSFQFILLHFKLVSFRCISFLSSLSPPLLGNFEALSLLASNSALHLLSVCHTISINGPGRGDLEVCRFKNNCRTSWNFAPLRQRNRRHWHLKVPRRVLLYKWREHDVFRSRRVYIYI